MDVKRGRMVFLGYGKYWRSDRILGLMPIEEGRGPDDSFRLEWLREATRELLEAFHEFSPVLRRALHNEHHFDVEKWEERLGVLLRPAEHPDPARQDDLFD